MSNPILNSTTAVFRKAFLSFVKFVFKLIKEITETLSLVYRRRYLRDLYFAIRYWPALKLKSELPDGLPNPASAAEIQEHNFRLIVDCLDAAGVRFVVVPIKKKNPFSTRLAVNMDDLQRVCTALENAPPTLLCAYGGALANLVWQPKKMPIHTLAKSAGLLRWKFFQSYNVHFLQSISKKAACEIEFYQQHNGYIYLKNPNDFTKYLKSDEPQLRAAMMGRQVSIWEIMADSKSAEVCEFPVDLVYTWVDGSDLEWQMLKAKHLGKEANYHQEATDAARFTCRDELKYSLRSVAFLSNFFRKIFIVTNGQVPSWLNINHPKIVLITHKEIFRDPEAALPTFNSHAIESNLHRIPDLSEHYIYLNDDCLFTQFINKELFVAPNGITFSFLNNSNNFGILQPDEGERYSPFINAGRNSVAIIRQLFGIVASSTVRHAPYVQRKSVCEYLETEILSYLAETERAKFRSSKDVSLPSSLAILVALAQEKSVMGQLETSTISLSTHMDFSLALIRLRVFKDRIFLCVNDTACLGDAEKRVDQELADFMETYFPVKSEFEI